MSALLDSGTTGMFINHTFIQKHKLETQPLPNPVPVHNVDGTLNKNGVGRKTVLYMNCLQRPNWQPEHAFTIVLNSAMNLTCKNQGSYSNSGGRIKSWNFRSAPNIVVHILKNPVNSYDSNGVIAVPISTLGDKKKDLLFFCLPIFFPSESPQRIRTYYTSLTRSFQVDHKPF